MKEENIVRKVLNNEFTQITGIVIAVWFFVTNVILPITNIQSSLASIQLTLADIKTINSNFDARITQNSNDIIRLQGQFGNLSK